MSHTLKGKPYDLVGLYTGGNDGATHDSIGLTIHRP